MPSSASGFLLILVLAFLVLGLILFIAWKAGKIRWLLWILPVLLVG